MLVAALATAAAPGHADSPAPWRLRDATGAPVWLDFGLEHRSRFEYVQDQFRAPAPQSNTALVMRTLVSARATSGGFAGVFELQDSRAYATDDTPLRTSVVNPFEPLQAYLAWRGASLFAPDDQLEVKLGRMTVDVGSRRLIARNRFRNTINGFSGAHMLWKSRSGYTLRAFTLLPVVRRPSDAAGLADNDIELDEDNTDALLWGVEAAAPRALAGTNVEGYVLGLHERDGDIASRNRQLITFGGRAVRKRAPGRVDYEIEAIAQLGSSRASTDPADTTDLDHRAWFVHAELGHTCNVAWQPRLSAEYDYASGDADPDDDVNGRFTTLFGVVRYEFGPTDIWSSFARANINSPGVRLRVRPSSASSAFAAYRLYWLASATDAWTRARLRDPTGGSGKFLGSQVDVRLRWKLVPRNLRFELGGTVFVRGRFATDVPGGRDDPGAFFYAQVAGWI